MLILQDSLSTFFFISSGVDWYCFLLDARGFCLFVCLLFFFCGTRGYFGFLGPVSSLARTYVRGLLG